MNLGTVTQCLVDPTAPVLLTAKPLENLLKSLRTLMLGRHLKKDGICFGNWPIANFFMTKQVKRLWQSHNMSFSAPDDI